MKKPTNQKREPRTLALRKSFIVVLSVISNSSSFVEKTQIKCSDDSIDKVGDHCDEPRASLITSEYSGDVLECSPSEE